VIRSKRKTISLQIDSEGNLFVRSPLRMSDAAIRAFVESKEAWIHKHLQARAQLPALPVYTNEHIRILSQQAMTVIPVRVAYYAPLVGVDYGKITIRHQKTRWGSCSGKSNLNFNCLLMEAPPEVVDYVVVHELCHRKEMNHSKAFWAEVARILPDYKMRRTWLKEHSAALIGRLK